MDIVEYKGLLIPRNKRKDGNTIHLTEDHIKNYIDLVLALAEVPPPIFNMSTFADVERKPTMKLELRRIVMDDPKANQDYYLRENPYTLKYLGDNNFAAMHSCRTSACAVGTAAYRNIGVINPSDDWVVYTMREFGVAPNMSARSITFGMTEYHHEAFTWMFGEEWFTHDNTPFGAAMRILYFLHYGLHEEFQDKVDNFFDIGGYASVIYHMVTNKNLWPEGFNTDIDLEGFVKVSKPEGDRIQR